MSLSLPVKAAILGPGVPWRTIATWPWFQSPLVPPSCDGPRQRLRAWSKAGCPETPATAVAYAGDPSLEPLVRRALEQLPPPVRWWAADCVLVTAIGRVAAGIYQLVAPPACSRDALRLVAIAGGHADDDVAAIVLHELGHAWSDDVRTAADARALLATADTAAGSFAGEFCRLPDQTAQQVSEALAQVRFTSETRAIGFARLCGAKGFPADPASARRARDLRRAELQALRPPRRRNGGHR